MCVSFQTFHLLDIFSELFCLIYLHRQVLWFYFSNLLLWLLFCYNVANANIHKYILLSADIYEVVGTRVNCTFVYKYTSFQLAFVHLPLCLAAHILFLFSCLLIYSYCSSFITFFNSVAVAVL